MSDIVPEQLAYEQISDWTVQFKEGGKWFNVALSCFEANTLMRTGQLDDKAVSAVKLLYVSDSDNPEIGKCWFIYDFKQAAQGIPAWRLQYEPAN